MNNLFFRARVGESNLSNSSIYKINKYNGKQKIVKITTSY